MKIESMKTRCEHGKNPQECEECFFDKNSGNPCISTISQLLKGFDGAKEKAQRGNHSHTIDTELKFKEENLQLKLLNENDTELIARAYAFLETIFDPEQLVSSESFARNIKGLTKKGAERPKYRVFCITNEEEDIIAVRVMESLPIFNAEGSTTGKNMLYAIYIAVKEGKYRGNTGIAKQMYISSLLDAAIQANKTGSQLDSIIAECSDATERLQNAVGLKRVYFESNGSYDEFAYLQPCMDFDKETGKPLETEPKEHFMIYRFGQEITKEDVISTAISLVKQYKSNLTSDDFNNTEAFSAYQSYFDRFAEKMIDKISRSGEIKLMSYQERKDIENSGIVVKTHKPPKEMD